MFIGHLYGWIFSLIFLCKAQSNNEKIKNQIVHEIVQKVFNITSNALTEASPSLKNNMLEKIESKLKSSAQRFGVKGDKYVQLIIDGLTILSNKSSAVEPTRKQSDGFTTLPLQYQNNFRIGSHTNTKSSYKSNDPIVNQIAEKVLNIVKKYSYNGNTAEEKRLIIQSIRNKVIESAKKQHNKIHTTHEEIKAYTDLITHGMELMMKELAQSKRGMIINNDDKDTEGTPINNMSRENKDLKENAFNAIYNGLSDISSPDTLTYGIMTSISCDAIVFQTCTDVKFLNEYICPDSGKILSLNKLCDGVADCSKASDEEKCLEQVITRIQNAIRVMSRVENYLLKQCFISRDNALLVKHNIILKDVLRKQLEFLNKYTNIKQYELPKDTKSIKRMLNEVVLVINALDIALDGSLCTKRNTSNIDIIADNQISLSDNDIDDTRTPGGPQSNEISLKSCLCVESFCTGISCPEACKNVCWHKYNLGRWGCQAIDETTSVALDLLCDGKLDCYDETDEIPCSTGATITKFEANEMYDTILNILKIKSVSKEYLVVQNKLMSLYAAVKELQKETFKIRVDSENIKSIRDNCFSQLVSIYDDMVNKATHELHDVQLFLLTLNEKLGTALKLSHTGNDKIISRSGCICREFQCLLPQCSKSCKIACSVKPRLSKYWCEGSAYNNISIPIERICNKKTDCPFVDDEAQCLSDVCRKHHLIVLRQGIQDVGEKQKGTSLGETLISWRTKATATLKIAENNYRPTPTTFRDVINDILNDLVMAYASMDQNIITNRKNEYILKEFSDVSQRVMRSLRSCGQ